MEEVKECEYFNAYKKSSCKGLENPKCKVEDCVLQQLQLKDKEIDNYVRALNAQIKVLKQKFNEIELKDKMIELMAKHDFELVNATPSISYTTNIKSPEDAIEYYKQQALAELEKEKV